MVLPPPISTLFPYTTLFRSEVARRALGFRMHVIAYDPYLTREAAERHSVEAVELDELLARSDFITIHVPLTGDTRHLLGDRKSTRLNSSHANISYAVFCLKK